MEIEGFGEVAGIVALAKELHDIGRFDIVENKEEKLSISKFSMLSL